MNLARKRDNSSDECEVFIKQEENDQEVSTKQDNNSIKAECLC